MTRTRPLAAALALAAAVGVASALAVPRAPAWRPGIRLLERLPEALALPDPPPRRTLVSLRVLPAVAEGEMYGIPFTPEPGRPVVLHARVNGEGDARARIELFELTAAEARTFGTAARALPAGANVGDSLGVCLERDEHATGWAECKLLVKLAPDRALAVAVVSHPASGVKDLEVSDADMGNTRLAHSPRLSPLVRRWSGRSTNGIAWRTSLVAPPGGRYEFAVELPGDKSELVLGLGLDAASAPTRFVVRQDGRVLLDEVVREQDQWKDRRLALAGAPGSHTRIALESSSVEGGDVRGLWSDPRVLAASNAPSILLLSIDALRWDHMSAYGYARDTTPFLSELAAHGVRFERATAQAGHTWASVTSFLSGRYPANAGVRARGDPLPDDVPLLPDLLARYGYDTFGGNDLALFPPSHMASFDEAEATIFRSQAGVDEDIVKQVATLAPRMAERPVFAWLHLENTHYGYAPREPLRFDPGYHGRYLDTFRGDDHEDWDNGARVTPRELEHIYALYDSEIRDADAVVRRCLERLEKAGALERTIVVVTADHGEQLGEHGIALDHTTPWEQTLHVPLLFVYGGRLAAGHAVHERVQLVDLAPTLLSLAGLPPEPGFDGRDLSPALRGEPIPDAPAYADIQGLIFSMYAGDEHLIVNPHHVTLELKLRTKSLIKVQDRELYELARDPREDHDLSATDPKHTEALVELLHAEVQRWHARKTNAAPPGLGQETLDALRQAGYLPRQKTSARAGP